MSVVMAMVPSSTQVDRVFPFTSTAAAADSGLSAPTATDRILLLESDFQRRSQHLHILTQAGVEAGYEIDGAADIDEALVQLEQRAPAFILWVPSADHAWQNDTINELRSHHETRDIPVVVWMLTPDTEGFIPSAFASGARDVWVGPMRLEELSARICAQVKLERQFAQLRAQISIDPLTGILNRRGILEVLEHETNRLQRNQNALGILLIDVDAFKRINDNYGHVLGDEVLCSIGAALKQSIRRTDAVGRLGGDEFLVVLPDVSEAQAQQVADRVNEEIAALDILPHAQPVRVSIGIAVTESNRPSSKVLINDADQSMYQRKRANTNPFEPVETQ